MKRTKRRVLSIDIETIFNVGVFWRPSYKANIGHQNILEERKIIMASWKWLGENKVWNICWDKDPDSKDYYLPYCDKNVTETIIEQMELADEIVYQNGRRFDEPFIRGRAMKHGVEMPHDFNRFDTLSKSRSLLGLNSYKLDYLGQFFLEDAKNATGGIKLWFDVMRGDKRAIKKMVAYCNQDTLLLERYYNHLLPYVPVTTHVGVLDGHPRWTCPCCGGYDIRVKKRRVTARGIEKYGMYCKNGHHYTMSDFLYKQWMKDRD